MCAVVHAGIRGFEQKILLISDDMVWSCIIVHMRNEKSAGRRSVAKRSNLKAYRSPSGPKFDRISKNLTFKVEHNFFFAFGNGLQRQS